MIYDHNNLNNEEIAIFRNAVKEYKNHDKIDLVIELCFEENIKNEIKKRKKLKKRKEYEKPKNEALPESLKFCDGDSCQVDLTAGC